MPPYLTPLQIFENYKKANPQKCKGKSTTEICRLAGLSDKQIAELKTTSAWLFCFDKENTNSNQDFSITEILGGNFTSKAKTKLTKQEPAKQSDIQYHPVYKDLKLDSKGKIDMKQFSLDFIKQKYNSDDYNIEYKTGDDVSYGGEAEISVTKKDGTKVLSIEYYDSNIYYETFYNNEKTKNRYGISLNGIVEYGRHHETDGSSVAYSYADDGKTIKEYEAIDKNGAGKNIEYKNGNISRIYTFQLDKEGIYNTKDNICYYKGKPYRENDVNLFAQKCKNITYRDNNGYLVRNPAQIDELLTLIDKNNINEIIQDYRDMYKSELTDDIAKGWGSKDKIKELFAHIEKCLYKANGYDPNKKIKNDQIKNNNYASNKIYDVQYQGRKVIINNKTTDKKSVLDFDKLLKNIKDPIEKIRHMHDMQNLPTEILEFYANEGITLKGTQEIEKSNKIDFKNNKNLADGFYKYRDETITLYSHSDSGVYIHEIMHAIDCNRDGLSETIKEKFKEAFEIGLTRFEAAGYKRNTAYKPANIEEKELRYYFSSNAAECWARIGEMLFYGKCENQDILKQFWPEFIELEKQAIERIQNKPANERHH